MPGNPAQPFYFALVGPDETTFGPEHLLQEMDAGSLPIMDYALDHDEAGIPILTVEVINPKVGLLSLTGLWCWFSKYNPLTGAVVPMFFGRMAGSPSNLQDDYIHIDFIAEPIDFYEQKQRVAERFRVRPGYDPLLIDFKHQDDPDTILAGWSLRWHVGRYDQTVHVSDLLLPDADSDDGGTEYFAPQDVYRDSLRMEIAERPPAAVNVVADVFWTQKAQGVLGFGNYVWRTYTGNALISDWPKPLANLGSGWTVKTSVADDVFRVADAQMQTLTGNYQNNEDEHHIGDTMSANISESKPLLTSAMLSYQLDVRQVIGIISPDPDEKDVQPATVEISQLFVPIWSVVTSLTLRYRAERQRREQIAFTLYADNQALLPSQDIARRNQFPLVEQINLSGGDVGAPLITIRNWLAIKDTDVPQGMIVFTAYPSGGIEDSYQMVRTPGRTGAVQPTFSLIPGDETTDGTAVFVSLGANFSPTPLNWSELTFMRAGQFLLPEVDDYATWTDLVPPPRINGVNVSEGTYCLPSNNSGTLFLCTLGGKSGIAEPAWPTTYGAVVIDNEVEWTCVGTRRPDGTVYFQCVTQGRTNRDYLPNFNYTVGALTTDDTCVWKCLGHADDVAPVPIGDTSRRAYLPITRGNWTLEYLMMLGRAKLREKSRAVKISYGMPVDRALGLNCRKAGNFVDDRLPGGSVTGKIIKYGFRGNGDSGEHVAAVTIGCAIGNGGTVTSSAGTLTYVEDGVMDDAPATGAMVALQDDMAYSPPLDPPADDGLVFPLDRDQVVISEQQRGSLATQLAAINLGVANAKLVTKLEFQAAVYSGQGSYSAFQALKAKATALGKETVEAQLAKGTAAIWYDLQLRPINDGPFETRYDMAVSTLAIPKQIDLSAT